MKNILNWLVLILIIAIIGFIAGYMSLQGVTAASCFALIAFTAIGFRFASYTDKEEADAHLDWNGIYYR